MFLEPLMDLGFNSQKCCHTFVNWYYPKRVAARSATTLFWIIGIKKQDQFLAF
jgi:hypothetical protein